MRFKEKRVRLIHRNTIKIIKQLANITQIELKHKSNKILKLVKKPKNITKVKEMSILSANLTMIFKMTNYIMLIQKIFTTIKCKINPNNHPQSCI
jgi:hypothetical protein